MRDEKLDIRPKWKTLRYNVLAIWLDKYTLRLNSDLIKCKRVVATRVIGLEYVEEVSGIKYEIEKPQRWQSQYMTKDGI